MKFKCDSSCCLICGKSQTKNQQQHQQQLLNNNEIAILPIKQERQTFESERELCLKFQIVSFELSHFMVHSSSIMTNNDKTLETITMIHVYSICDGEGIFGKGHTRSLLHKFNSFSTLRFSFEKPLQTKFEHMQCINQTQRC